MSDLRLEQFSSGLLKPLDLTIKAGETVTLTGESGSGKSLLLRAIADLDEHQGEVWLNNQACTQMTAPQWRRQIGYLPAESSWWEASVAQHFPDEDPVHIQEFGLPDAAMQWEISRLSSGEKQRLALARLLASTPDALLLDEPTANLDPQHTLIIEKIIAEYQQQHQTPILWVSHDSQQRQRVSDRQLHITHSEIQED